MLNVNLSVLVFDESVMLCFGFESLENINEKKLEFKFAKWDRQVNLKNGLSNLEIVFNSLKPQLESSSLIGIR